MKKEEYRVLYIGAHPDDADLEAGGTLSMMAEKGARVRVISVCNGNKGHQSMASDELAARRLGEARAAAKVLGIEDYTILDHPDCELEAGLKEREELARLIRAFAPHVIITHRTCDYHADHRAVGQLVQDCTYLLGVPLWLPDAPVPEVKPLVVFSRDEFELPRVLRPDIMVDVTARRRQLIDAFVCHVSQLFEWLPWEMKLSDVPSLDDKAAVDAYVDKYWLKRKRRDAARFGGDWIRARGVHEAPGMMEPFEVSQYGRAPDANDLAWFGYGEGA